MATVTARLSLSSTNIAADSLSVNLAKILTVAGDYRAFKRVVASGLAELFTDGGIVLEAASYGKSYVLFHNTSTTENEIITLGLTDNDNAADNALETTNMKLGAGEFAFFPWDASTDIVADAAAGDPVLEVLLFEAS